MPKQQKEKCPSPRKFARAPARARAAAGPKDQPLALRVRKGATAMRWERGNAPIVHATHGNSSCKRELLGAPACLCVGCLPPPPARASPVGVHGRPPARIRPPKLAPAPSNAHEQPYPPTPQKKIRARAKAATKKGRAAASGAPTCRWTQPRAALTAQAAGRWRAHMPQQHLHCKNLLQNGGSVSVACARGPLLREDAPPCAAINALTCAAAAPPRT